MSPFYMRNTRGLLENHSRLTWLGFYLHSINISAVSPFEKKGSIFYLKKEGQKSKKVSFYGRGALETKTALFDRAVTKVLHRF